MFRPVHSLPPLQDPTSPSLPRHLSLLLAPRSRPASATSRLAASAKRSTTSATAPARCGQRFPPRYARAGSDRGVFHVDNHHSMSWSLISFWSHDCPFHVTWSLTPFSSCSFHLKCGDERSLELGREGVLSRACGGFRVRPFSFCLSCGHQRLAQIVGRYVHIYICTIWDSWPTIVLSESESQRTELFYS